jgi:hypothetical protein
VIVLAEGNYHKLIKDTIYKIARESNNHKEVNKEKKIPIPHPTKAIAPILYLPEINIKTKHGKKYIFEILDSQGEDYNLIVADIIQAYLIENVAKVFFIAKNKKEYDLAYRLSDIIGAKLEENGYKKNNLPEVNVYEIGKEDLEPQKLYDTLKRYAEKDKWI